MRHWIRAVALWAVLTALIVAGITGCHTSRSCAYTGRCPIVRVPR